MVRISTPMETGLLFWWEVFIWLVWHGLSPLVCRVCAPALGIHRPDLEMFPWRAISQVRGFPTPALKMLRALGRLANFWVAWQTWDKLGRGTGSVTCLGEKVTGKQEGFQSLSSALQALSSGHALSMPDTGPMEYRVIVERAGKKLGMVVFNKRTL